MYNITLDVDCENIDSILHEIEFDFPHVSNKLSILKGHPEFHDELRKLIISDRPNRQGFPKRIMVFLLKLDRLHAEQYCGIKGELPCEK